MSSFHFPHLCMFVIHSFFTSSIFFSFLHTAPLLPSFLPSPPNSFFFSFIHTISINLFFVCFLLFSIPSFHSLLPSFLPPSFIACPIYTYLHEFFPFPIVSSSLFLFFPSYTCPPFFLSFLPCHITLSSLPLSFFLHSFPLPSLPVSFLFSYPSFLSSHHFPFLPSFFFFSSFHAPTGFLFLPYSFFLSSNLSFFSIPCFLPSFSPLFDVPIIFSFPYPFFLHFFPILLS